MKNQKGVSLIALIITIIVIIILAAIVMQSSTGTVDQANFAGFAQEIGDYTSAVTTSAASIKADAAVEGVIINDAQKNYMLANGVKATDLKSGDGIMGYTVPADKSTQDKMPAVILRALGGYTSGDSILYYQARVPAYKITDDKFVEGYKSNFDFYGDSNGPETHYVTSDGTVFTLPGFPQTQEDKSIRYYINATSYYTVKGQSTLTAADKNADTNKDKIVDSPIQAADLTEFIALSATSSL